MGSLNVGYFKTHSIRLAPSTKTCKVLDPKGLLAAEWQISKQCHNSSSRGPFSRGTAKNSFLYATAMTKVPPDVTKASKPLPLDV